MNSYQQILTKNNKQIEINVGGKYFKTSLDTLKRDKNSFLARMFNGNVRIAQDADGRPFVDRDGVTFGYILDYLRSGHLFLPKGFNEFDKLEQEGRYFKLSGLLRDIKEYLKIKFKERDFKHANFVTVSIRSTFAFGAREVMDVAFRKTPRIIVAGNVGLIRSVFKETLNDSRDPNLESNGYTGRFFLTHNNLHQAFEQLKINGFNMKSCNAGKTNDGLKSNEEDKWSHFENYIFEHDAAEM